VTYEERESQAEGVGEGEGERVWWTEECEDQRGNCAMGEEDGLPELKCVYREFE
jgi:hypothetical protein